MNNRNFYETYRCVDTYEGYFDFESVGVYTDGSNYCAKLYDEIFTCKSEEEAMQLFKVKFDEHFRLTCSELFSNPSPYIALHVKLFEMIGYENYVEDMLEYVKQFDGTTAYSEYRRPFGLTELMFEVLGNSEFSNATEQLSQKQIDELKAVCDLSRHIEIHEDSDEGTSWLRVYEVDDEGTLVDALGDIHHDVSLTWFAKQKPYFKSYADRRILDEFDDIAEYYNNLNNGGKDED